MCTAWEIIIGVAGPQLMLQLNQAQNGALPWLVATQVMSFAVLSSIRRDDEETHE